MTDGRLDLAVGSVTRERRVWREKGKSGKRWERLSRERSVVRDRRGQRNKGVWQEKESVTRDKRALWLPTTHQYTVHVKRSHLYMVC